MKLLCINTDNIIHGTIEVGKEYSITQVYNSWYEVNGITVSLNNFESVKAKAKRLLKTANKVIIPLPTKGVTVDILLTDNYIILYSHTRGNHWNIFGNHYKYYHDINTGELIPDNSVQQPQKTLLKERLLMADYKEIEKERMAKFNPASK